MSKSYWIWNYGDYEIFHTMSLHLRREEQGYHRPPVWKISTPYVSIQFTKQFYCEKGYLICYMNGCGYIDIDNQRYGEKTRIELSKGEHTIKIFVSKTSGLPAIFVESDVCPSDGTWISNHFAGEFSPVGYNVFFNSVQRNPENFPFEYKNVLPISKEKINNGILYDFGTEYFGFLNITNACKNEEIRVFYGESKEEALDVENTYITDRVCGENTYRLKQRAFRYVYLKTLLDDIEISADYEYLPLEQKGNFRCNDELFNKIYSVASYTFHLNCREAFLDGIKRDRWVWSGDAYQSARINRYLFADKEIEQRTLLGLLGREPIEQHINTIIDYSLLWFISLYEHYMAYGDKEFLKRVYPMAKKLLEFCETKLNKEGFIEGDEKDWTFIDWSDIEKVGAVCAEQMLLIRAYQVMSLMAEVLDNGDKNLLEKKYEFLIRQVNAYYWNEEKGAFIDCYKSGNANVTRHANIFAIMYDIATKEQTQKILKNVLKNDNITKITTPYFEGYELDVLAKLGDFKAVEDKITSYWGGMINLGASTIWEEYDPKKCGIDHYEMYGGKYEKSLCHAWGAGPIYLFGRYYLGVYATSVGYETFIVKPNLGGLKEISGAIPINGGTVVISLDKEKLRVVASKPGGTLVWDNKSYILQPNKAIEIIF